MFQYHRMTRDMPARVEAHAAFAVGEDLYPLGIERIEAGIGEHIPMGRQKIVEPVILALAGESAGCIRRRLEALEKVSQCRFERLRKDMAVLPEQFTLSLVEACKA
jgi:hypothetical protein